MKRIPLLIHFPGDAHIGRIRTNTQQIDIAPTVLDFMGLSIPSWMEGESLLREDLQQAEGDRPIISTGIKNEFLQKSKLGKLIVEEKPPFYSIGVINVISCNLAYHLDLISREWQAVPLSESSLTCTPIPADEAYQLMLDHLRARHYDLSSLEGFKP